MCVIHQRDDETDALFFDSSIQVVPLFVTALMVPFLVVVLRVLRSQDGLDKRLSAAESTK